MRSLLFRSVVIVLGLAATVSARPADAVAQSRSSTAQPPLYERLGGVYAIAVVVDAFIDVLLLNDALNTNPAIAAARDRVPRAGLKFHVTTLVCQVTGGPCTYTGRTMKDSHAHLNITAREWDAMVADFRRVLNNFQVPAREQQELLAIVETTRADIVVGGGSRQ